MSVFRGGAIHPGHQVGDDKNDNVSIDGDNYGRCLVNQPYVQDARSVMMKNAILDGCGIVSNKWIGWDWVWVSLGGERYKAPCQE